MGLEVEKSLCMRGRFCLAGTPRLAASRKTVRRAKRTIERDAFECQVGARICLHRMLERKESSVSAHVVLLWEGGTGDAWEQLPCSMLFYTIL